MDSALIPIYFRLPITIQSGKGVWLYDTDGNKYLDAIGSMGVAGLGHCHPVVEEAMKEQLKKLIHCSNNYHVEEQELLAHEFVEFAGMDKVLFANSGAESNEAAIKLIRLYGRQRNIKSPTAIVFEGGFLGRTMGTLSGSSEDKVRKNYDPYLPGFVFAEFNKIDAIKKILAENPDIVAIMLEPILGQGGVHVPDDDYLLQLRKICDERKLLLVLDEIQTGMGRTGRNFAYQQYALRPDILTTAKCLGNGLPVGACSTTKELSDLFSPGTHGTTFGGNALVCHVVRAIIRTLREGSILQNVAEVGGYLLTNLQDVLSKYDVVREVRGKGLMIGVELDGPCSGILKHGLEEGLLFNVTAQKVIRMLPPYILTREEADLIVERLKRCIKKYSVNRS
jgi:acetylornithine aminotransferase